MVYSVNSFQQNQNKILKRFYHIHFTLYIRLEHFLGSLLHYCLWKLWLLYVVQYSCIKIILPCMFHGLAVHDQAWKRHCELSQLFVLVQVLHLADYGFMVMVADVVLISCFQHGYWIHAKLLIVVFAFTRMLTYCVVSRTILLDKTHL